MQKIKYKINRQGRAWTSREILPRLRAFPAKAELIDGKLFWTEEERETALALLLELIGIDKAIRFGDLQMWKEAIEDLENQVATNTGKRKLL
jgi:hypothetical protein